MKRLNLTVFKKIVALKQQKDSSTSSVNDCLEVVNASGAWQSLNGRQNRGILVTGIENCRMAHKLKRHLKKLYPMESAVLLRTSQKKGDRLQWISLHHLDKVAAYSQDTCLYLPPVPWRTMPELEKLLELLRSRRGCPWDRRQNHRSLRPYLIEEAYEVVEAIEKDDADALKEELGDLLLQVVFHAQIASEKGRFSMSDVVEGIATKIIRRHPHVFGRSKTTSVEEVLKNWEEIKKREPQKSTTGKTNAHLPSLIQALKIQKRASKLGFDWNSVEGTLDKLKEEIAELEYAYDRGLEDKIEEELGDLLFSVVNLARFLRVNPEICLRRAVNKFKKRFSYVEEKVCQTGKDFTCFNLEELDNWWEEAKKFGEKSNK